MRGAFSSVWVELISEKYVPPHLRRVYPSAFSIFLAIFGITIYPGSGFAGTIPGYLLDILGLVVMFLLIGGWFFNKRSWTEHGFWFAAGYWGTAAAYTLMSVRENELLSFTLMVCIAFVNLAVGSWVLMRKDPR